MATSIMHYVVGIVSDVTLRFVSYIGRNSLSRDCQQFYAFHIRWSYELSSAYRRKKDKVPHTKTSLDFYGIHWGINKRVIHPYPFVCDPELKLMKCFEQNCYSVLVSLIISLCMLSTSTFTYKKCVICISLILHKLLSQL